MLLVDVRMPGIDGLTVLKRVKETDPYPPVVLTTAYAEISASVAARRAAGPPAPEAIPAMQRGPCYARVRHDLWLDLIRILTYNIIQSLGQVTHMEESPGI
jgi:CheY-like chemotaxis protein